MIIYALYKNCKGYFVENCTIHQQIFVDMWISHVIVDMFMCPLVLSLILCLILSLSIPATAMADSGDGDITILYTNDVHTYMNNDGDDEFNYAKLATLKKQYKDVLLVDAGDHIQGTAYGSMDKGKTIVELMNAAGYDIATLGNHEFDYGMEGTMNVIDWADYEYISCNFFN